MFFQLLRVQHSCSATQSRGGVLPSISETRDQKFPGLPPSLFELESGIFLCKGDINLIHPQPVEVVDHSRSKMHETCLIIIHDPSLRLGSESNWGPLN